ncbi:MAG: hypothetical protein C0603_13025 [Denitrovibrio sp.]|nr:MAG: hypothetical protein C0603_13025 [Denitrovibrio sp.]
MNKGFTLIELAIVMIIIGIILGSAIKSTEIIKDARAKANITDITKLADAQHTFYERVARFAGDSDNDGQIDFTSLNSTNPPDEANTTNSGDMDFAFQELENLGILPVKTNSDHATIRSGGPAYFAGSTVTDVAGNNTVLNMIVVRQVPCLTAFAMEQNIDKSSPDAANSASTGRVRYIDGTALEAINAWTVNTICANNPDTLTNLAYLFDRF